MYLKNRLRRVLYELLKINWEGLVQGNVNQCNHLLATGQSTETEWTTPVCRDDLVRMRAIMEVPGRSTKPDELRTTCARRTDNSSEGRNRQWKHKRT